MPHTQADLELAERHVEDGARRITEQKQRLASLEIRGLPTDDARQLLHSMEDIQQHFRRHLWGIANDVADHRTDTRRL